jgi:hypothetical protein
MGFVVAGFFCALGPRSERMVRKGLGYFWASIIALLGWSGLLLERAAAD